MSNFSELYRSLALLHPVELYIRKELIVCQIFALGYNAQGKIACVLRQIQTSDKSHSNAEWLVIEVEKVSYPRLLAQSYVPRPLDNKVRPRLYKEIYTLNY